MRAYTSQVTCACTRWIWYGQNRVEEEAAMPPARERSLALPASASRALDPGLKRGEAKGEAWRSTTSARR